MNEPQAAQVLAAMSAAWPNHDMPDETIRLWVGLMADIDVEDAMPAVKVIVREDRFFPPISRFLQVCEERHHARANRIAADRGLNAARIEPATPQPELLEALHWMLEAQRTARHRHGGPQPCPVCGGLAPPAAQRREQPRNPRRTPGLPSRTCGLRNCQTCNPNDPQETP